MSSSSFGFDEYSTKEPVTDDEPVFAEMEELGKPEIDELEKQKSKSQALRIFII